MSEDAERLPVVYSPSTGRIACPIIQAMFGCNTFVPHDFPTEHWDTAPNDTQRKFADTREAWRAIGAMPIAERIARWEAAVAKTANKPANKPAK